MTKFCLLFLLGISCVGRAGNERPKMDYGILTDTGEYCPTLGNEKGFQESSMPGYQPHVKFGFVRDQDYVGQCLYMATADYFCYKLNLMGLWPHDSQHNKGCSAFDLQLMTYQAVKKQKGLPNTITPLIEEDFDVGSGSNRKKESRFLFQPEMSELIRLAQEKGLCSENAFPSEYVGDHGQGIYSIYRQAQENLRKVQSRAQTDAGIGLEGLCPECTKLAPVLTSQQWRQIKNLIEHTDLQNNELDVLQKINDLACPAEKRIKLPKNFTMEKNDFDYCTLKTGKGYDGCKELQKRLSPEMNERVARPFKLADIKRRLNNGEVGLLDVDGGKLAQLVVHNLKVKNPAQHAVILTEAAYLDHSGDPNPFTGCFYGIKNSWGNQCFENLPYVHCDANGKIWIRWQELTDITINSYWEKK